MGISKNILFACYVLFFLLTFNLLANAAFSGEVTDTTATIERVSNSIFNTQAVGTVFVYRTEDPDNGYFYHILHFHESDGCRKSGITAALDKKSKTALVEEVLGCRVGALSVVFSEKDLPIRAGYHFDVRIASIPEGFFVYLSTSKGNEHLLIINSKHSWIGLTDSLIAIDQVGRSNLSELAIADSAFSFAEHRWDYPISYEKLVQKLDSGKYKLFEAPDVESGLADDECAGITNDGGDESTESFWQCTNCNSGGANAIFCSCAASFTSSECSVFCNPTTSYACCRCGAWTNRCSCCSGGGGGGAPFPPPGWPPLPPPWEEEE